MKQAFYIFGTAQGQDMFPVLFESIKQGNDCWVCFFDCFSKKRQLANYSKEEVEIFFEDKCKELGIKFPTVDFFTAKDESRYKAEYSRHKPEIVFIQEINPKFPIWYPKTPISKVVHFAWWDESKHLINPQVKVDVSILKQADDTKYGYSRYPHAYFGNLRMDHLQYSNPVDRKKRCFIPETYLRMSPKYRASSMQIVKFCDELIRFLRKNGFEVVWKKREKGYPLEGWASPLDFCKEKPDVIIEKDLNFPSSLIDYAYNSDICMVINDCFAFFDMMHVNTNCCILTTPGGRQHKIDDFFAEDHSHDIVDMKLGSGWENLADRLKKSNSFSYVFNGETSPSRNILNFCKEL